MSSTHHSETGSNDFFAESFPEYLPEVCYDSHQNSLFFLESSNQNRLGGYFSDQEGAEDKRRNQQDQENQGQKVDTLNSSTNLPAVSSANKSKQVKTKKFQSIKQFEPSDDEEYDPQKRLSHLKQKDNFGNQTRNFPAFIKRAFIEYFDTVGFTETDSPQLAFFFEKTSFNYPKLSRLLLDQNAREHLQILFDSRYLVRQIMSRSIKIDQKIRYIQLVSLLQRKFQKNSEFTRLL